MLSGVIQIFKSASTGNLLGITAKGTIDTNTQLVQLKGAISPAYKINSLFGVGDIPVLGKIITGSEGEGVFSAKYSVEGYYNNPEGFDIKVNVLSAITPGFLRGIF